MSEPVKPRRPYRSAVRAERARQSRDRILDAATTRFLELGFGRASVRVIAGDAGVSEDLVFHLFGSKRGLLGAVMSREPDPGLETLAASGGAAVVRDEEDQRRQVALLAERVGADLARVRPLDDMLRAAAAVDPELAAVREDLHLRRRREATTAITRWMHDRGPLRQGVDEASALVWTLTSPEVHHLLVEGWGWSQGKYVDWLRTNLEAGLLS
ncbi:TetR/AcrR family transcriptional regulator [Nocardioides sp. LS1]|uniref:TetR/AcrR family transcriptional regulator n=1 Tax=Nocardioides sp. LS1 TaxID=1027620 RepID=UPI000F62343C|nr:TetR/AcrR family transcriptional regulator [Nocardioides sp. LS1]